MNRRSFVMSLFGGVAAAGLGGTAMAQAASAKLEALPAAGDVETGLKTGLDQADAEFSQYRPHHRRPHRRPPPPPPRHRRRRRRVVRNGRVYWVY